MKVLSNNRAIKEALATCLKECQRTRWAVAWASPPKDLFGALWKHRAKIEQLTVGRHFHQTHPDFIWRFIKHPNAQFVPESRGVFHPKFFYFENQRKKWNCIIGSANFTAAAMSKNVEVAVWIDQDDGDSEKAQSEIKRTLDYYRNNLGKMKAEELAEYRKSYLKRQKKLGNDAKSQSGLDLAIGLNGVPKPLLEVDPLPLSWSEFANGVKREKLEGGHAYEDRLDVLEVAARAFRKYGKFKNIEDRRLRHAIAGTIENYEGIPSGYFGHTRNARRFRTMIAENNSKISAALDEIPRIGKVDQRAFQKFRRKIEAAPSGIGIACKSRLLAMKRPDYFVCFNGRNKSGLSKAFGVPESLDCLGRYWSEIICPIQETKWWSSARPTNKKEARIWKGRAAFLDSFFYIS